MLFRRSLSIISLLHALILCAALILATGCSVGSQYHAPEVETPLTWKNQTTNTLKETYGDYWWEVFNDPLLNSMEQDLLSKNYDLQTAYEKIQEARSLMNAEKSELFPHLYLNPFSSNIGTLYEGYTDGIIVRAHELIYRLPFQLSYEVDLWGKIRNRYHAAYDHWEGQIQAYNSIMLILTSELASVFYQIRTFDSQIDLLEAIVKTRERALKINRSRYHSKLIDFSDVSRSELEVTNAFAERRELIRIRAELENRLAVLVGAPASEFHFCHYPLEGFPPLIPAGIPSETLLRRPDIAEAERAIATEHALANAAYAAFFPSLYLTGEAGFASPHLKYFLTDFGRLWGWTSAVSQMIFDAGRLSAELSIQESRFKEASTEYQQKVLLCFAEVEDALSNLENYAKEYEDVSESVAWAKKTYTIANNRYQSGVISYLEVVIAERDELLNQVIQKYLQGRQFLLTVQLIKTLGGGWNECIRTFDE